MTLGNSCSRRLLVAGIAVSLISVAAPSLGAQRDNFIIVPGQSFGPIKKGATLVGLQRIYGKANIRVRLVQPPHADFAKQRAAVIFPGTPNEAVAFLSERGNRVESVVVQKRGGKWRTRKGLKIGLAVARMERLYGGPFAITGFGRDGGGAINTVPANAPARALYVRFAQSPDVTPSAADSAALEAEKGFRSDHPAARRARLTVSVIWWDISR